MQIALNRSFAERGTVFADPVVATATLDRLLHHNHVLTIRGDSYRLRAKLKSGLTKAPAPDGPPVGSAPLRPGSSGGQPSTDMMNPKVGQFFITQRGSFGWRLTGAVDAATLKAHGHLATKSSSSAC
ncbi:hypothetical protein GGD67_002868 [Bradyrhizobium sp. IAR9]|nr:hypothetical protein [Bradyrhizobium sp. IAR9]